MRGQEIGVIYENKEDKSDGNVVSREEHEKLSALFDLLPTINLYKFFFGASGIKDRIRKHPILKNFICLKK